MLSPRWRKMLRDVWLHRSRTLLIVIALTVGMIAADALLDTWILVESATTREFVASHPVSATLRFESIDDETLARIRALPEISAVRMRRAIVTQAQSNGDHFAVELFAYDDFRNQAIGRLESLAGAWPPPDGSIVIETSSLDFAHASLGGSLTFNTVEPSSVTVPIVGVVRDVSLPPGWMDHVVYGFATLATLARLGEPTSFDELQLVAADEHADRDAMRRIAYDVKTLAERDGHRVVEVDVPIPRQHAHAAQMQSVLLTQSAFAVLTLLVTALLVTNLMNAIVTAQTRQIGIQKTLGASPKQIAAMYSGMALVIGAIASAMALPIGAAIGHPYAALNASRLNFPMGQTFIPGWVIVLEFCAGCLIPVIASIGPIVRACSMSVVSALRDTGVGYGDNDLRRRIALPGCSRPLSLSVDNAFRQRQRFALTLIALAAGGAVYFGADDLRHSVGDSVDLLFAGEHHEIILRTAQNDSPRSIEKIALSVAEVTGAAAFADIHAKVVHADGLLGNTFDLLALPSGTPLFAPRIAAGRWLESSGSDTIVVSRQLLRDEPELAAMSGVTLDIDGQKRRFRIIGIADAGPQKIAYANLAAFGDRRVSMVAIATGERDASSQLETIQRLRDAFETSGKPIANSRLVNESRSAIEDHLLMVVNFLGAMGWVLILVGGIGFASTMSLSILERTREIGVMRAIGARNAAIIAMVQIEGFVYVFLGWLLALLLSMPVSAGLSIAFGKVMFTAPIRWLPDASTALEYLVGSIVVSLIACAASAWRALRVPISLALNDA